ncbi:MAG: hypothetical protein QG574_2510, partial [Cyanobacteriota bacterium erpe_2018_sw_21hr_WHONDRS-SW48-000092_B_bin.40]|nr:hypothetical protein [Cyanobacteriota bacterium erpe_2018_sw_21hr_WHONDRS-SW48-000092_B_bin.40]
MNNYKNAHIRAVLLLGCLLANGASALAQTLELKKKPLPLLSQS